MPTPFTQRSIYLTLALALSLTLGLVACWGGKANPQAEATAQADAHPPGTVEDARAFYASQPIYMRPAPPTTVPTGLPDLKASTCGACHQAIYKEWQVSTHAQAWEGDPQFQAELHKGDPAEKDVRWMCVNCHTPMEGQLERLVVGLEDGQVEKPIYIDNPSFDPTFQADAITCATCHVRDGVVLGPYGDTQAPHPVKKDPGLTTVDTCTQCHQAKAEFQHIALACVFDTGNEHASSPQAAEGKTCQSCHMPEVERTLTPFTQTKRTTRRHYFGGSLIPKTPAMAEAVKDMAQYYDHGLEARWVDLPKALPKGGAPLTLTLAYQNANAGHYIPSGDPERFINVEAKALGPDGALLGEASVRLGTVYEWWPAVKLLSDNRLAPQEKRTLKITLPPELPETITLKVKASKWRLSEENLAYHDLEGKVVPGIVFLDETLSLGAPVK